MYAKRNDLFVLECVFGDVCACVCGGQVAPLLLVGKANNKGKADFLLSLTREAEAGTEEGATAEGRTLCVCVCVCVYVCVCV